GGLGVLVGVGGGGWGGGGGGVVSGLADESVGLRVIVADSIDPESFGALLGRLDLGRTLFDVVSKSGETAETMAQFLIVRDRLLRELGAGDYKGHLIVTTDAREGALRHIVNARAFRRPPTPAGAGGRFSRLPP